MHSVLLLELGDNCWWETWEVEWLGRVLQETYVPRQRYMRMEAQVARENGEIQGIRKLTGNTGSHWDRIPCPGRQVFPGADVR